jgi:hypothetical protein
MSIEMRLYDLDILGCMLLLPHGMQLTARAPFLDVRRMSAMVTTRVASGSLRASLQSGRDVEFYNGQR